MSGGEEKREYYPLSITQKTIAVTERYMPKQTIENSMEIIGSGLFDRNGFDAQAMEKAFFEIVRRNDSLRLRLLKRNGRIMQYVQEFREYPIERKSLPGGERAFAAMCNAPEKPKMSMYAEKLWDAVIYDCGNGEGGIAIWLHHICSDGYSLDSIIYDQFCQFYACFKKGEIPAEAKKLYSYTDYLNAEHNRKGKKLREDFFQWLKEYNSHLRGYSIPVKVKRGDMRHSVMEAYLSDVEYEKLSAFCRERHCSIPSVVNAAAAVVTYCLSGKHCFQVSALSHGRMTFSMKKTTGSMQMNVPVFFDISDSMLVGELVQSAYMKNLTSLSRSKFSYLTHCYVFAFLHNLLRVGFLNEHCWLEVSSLEHRSTDKEDALAMYPMAMMNMYDVVYLEINEVPGKGLGFKLDYAVSALQEEKAQMAKELFLRTIVFFYTHPDSSVVECIEKIKIGNKEILPS